MVVFDSLQSAVPGCDGQASTALGFIGPVAVRRRFGINEAAPNSVVTLGSKVAQMVPDLLQEVAAGCKRFNRDRRGVTSLEYGLIAAVLVAIAVYGAANLGRKLQQQFDTVGDHVEASVAPGPSASTGSLTGVIVSIED